MERSKLNFRITLTAFLLVVFLLVIHTININLNYSLQAAQNRYNKLLEDNKILFLKIETANDLKEIDKRAQEELGMSFPKKIEYISE